MPFQIPLRDAAPVVEFEAVVQFVLNQLDRVDDFRKERGRQIELRGTLALAILAMAAGKVSNREIARYGQRRSETLIPLLGLVRAPSYSTVRRLLIGVDPAALRGVLQRVASELVAGRQLIVSVDGKSMSGSRTETGRVPHVATLFENNMGIVLDAKECAHGASELATGRKMATELLGRKPQVLVETGDALYAERGFAAAVTERGRHYALKLKKTSRAS